MEFFLSLGNAAIGGAIAAALVFGRPYLVGFFGAMAVDLAPAARRLACFAVHPRHICIDDDGTFAACRRCEAVWKLQGEGWDRIDDEDKCRRVIYETRYYAPGIVVDKRSDAQNVVADMRVQDGAL